MRLSQDLEISLGVAVSEAARLGHEYAGMFSNDDRLCDRLTKAGQATGERVWRMPLGPEYDKLIDSKFADVKNTGGRWAGAITAAQFLKRFVKDTPWVHLDVAGTAMGSPQTEINRSWASGWGVRSGARSRVEVLTTSPSARCISAVRSAMARSFGRPRYRPTGIGSMTTTSARPRKPSRRAP